MKQLVLNIPDNEYNFILKLLKSFSFVEFKTTTESDVDIPVNQKDIVRERAQEYNSNPQNIIEWEDIDNNIMQR